MWGLAQRMDEFVVRDADVAWRMADDVDEVADMARRVADDVDEIADARVAQRMEEFVTRSDDVVRHSDEVADARHADGNGASCKLPVRNSFTAGTLVETDEGAVPIEEIAAGDMVFGEDPETGKQGYYEVASVRSHVKDEVVQVTISAESTADTEDTTDVSDDNETDDTTTQTELMTTTPDHPVYVEGRGWIWAENLEPGDRLRRADGGMAKVLALEQIQLDEPELVYNFTVKGPHTYFVLEVGVLVHNESPLGCLNPDEQEQLQRKKDEIRTRMLIVAHNGGKYNCRECAEAMKEEFPEDTFILITSPKFKEQGLVGPGGEDIGAPKGWHVIIKTNDDMVWDNFGKKGDDIQAYIHGEGNIDKYLSEMQTANPGATITQHQTKLDLWHAISNFKKGAG